MPDRSKVEQLIEALRAEIAQLRDEVRAHAQAGHTTDGVGANDAGAGGSNGGSDASGATGSAGNGGASGGGQSGASSGGQSGAGGGGQSGASGAGGSSGGSAEDRPAARSTRRTIAAAKKCASRSTVSATICASGAIVWSANAGSRSCAIRSNDCRTKCGDAAIGRLTRTVAAAARQQRRRRRILRFHRIRRFHPTRRFHRIRPIRRIHRTAARRAHRPADMDITAADRRMAAGAAAVAARGRLTRARRRTFRDRVRAAAFLAGRAVRARVGPSSSRRAHLRWQLPARGFSRAAARPRRAARSSSSSGPSFSSSSSRVLDSSSSSSSLRVRAAALPAPVRAALRAPAP